MFAYIILSVNILLCFISAVLNIAIIGKARHPVTPGVAVVVMIFNLILITGFVYLWTVVN